MSLSRYATVKAFLLTFAVTFLVLAVSDTAFSWTTRSNSCEYDAGSISPIQYRFFSVNSAYETALKDAEADWDAEPVPGYFAEHSTSFDPEINVTDGNYASGAWAWNIGPCTSDGTYDGNETETRFNRSTMDSLSAFEKRLVAEHELGHAYGLGHVSSGCHIMRTGSYKFSCGSLPSQDDQDGVNALY